MGFRMKDVIFLGFTENPIFRREGSQKTNIKRGFLKRGPCTVCQFKGRELGKKRGGVDTSMHTTSSQNSLKVTTNYYEKKYFLVITKNKKHSSKQVVPITYKLKKRLFAAATFQGFWVVSFQTK